MSQKKDKPELSLISGKESLDLKSLRQLYINLTGKEPTPEEMEDARNLLEAEKRQGQ